MNYATNNIVTQQSMINISTFKDNHNSELRHGGNIFKEVADKWFIAKGRLNPCGFA
jgi:hypothetical protein